MTNDRNGPPEREEPGPTPGTGPLEKSAGTTHTDKVHATANPRLCAGDALHRRRQASYRCEPLASGHRDPWQPWRPATLSDKQVEGAVEAAEHLRDAGLTPRFDLDTLRVMWRAGHHQLVNELRSGGQ